MFLPFIISFLVCEFHTSSCQQEKHLKPRHPESWIAPAECPEALAVICTENNCVFGATPCNGAGARFVHALAHTQSKTPFHSRFVLLCPVLLTKHFIISALCNGRKWSAHPSQQRWNLYNKWLYFGDCKWELWKWPRVTGELALAFA